LPDDFVTEAHSLLLKISHQDKRKPILEGFKENFCRALGKAHYWSSDTAYAEYDLREDMREAKNQAPLFLEALYDSVEGLRAAGKYHAPELDVLNEMCRDHGVPYEIRPPALLVIAQGQPAVARPAPPATLAENAASILNQSMHRAEELLGENHSREAVQEILWMLESLVTTFRGIPTPAGQIRGKYFNEIAKEIRTLGGGTTLERVIEWLTQLHGYLSSPTGGGVRHGLDLNAGTPVSAAEARLFVNLVLSYVSFLLAEYERLRTTGGPPNPDHS
jgi:hypothetical protein